MQTILIADDEESTRRLIEITLESPDCRLLEASNGAAAFEVACRELPDLIVLDWMMPGNTNLQVVDQLRRHGPTTAIPIILLTGMGQERDKQQGLAAGAMAYLVKPFSPLQLLQLVQQVRIRKESIDEAAKNIDGRKRSKLAYIA